MTERICPKCGQPYDIRKLNWWAKSAKGKLYHYDAYGHRKQSRRRKWVNWCRISKAVSREHLERSKPIDFDKIMQKLDRDLTTHDGVLKYKGEKWSARKKGVVKIVKDVLSTV